MDWNNTCNWDERAFQSLSRTAKLIRLIGLSKEYASQSIVFLSSFETVCFVFLLFSLPLGLLSGQELLQNAEILLQTGQPGNQLLLHLGLVVAKLGVEVLAVGGGAHGGTEDGLDEERVVGLEGVAVGGAEGDAEFFV